MNWYYMGQEHQQRMNTRREEAAQERLAGTNSVKPPPAVRGHHLILIFTLLGRWLISWRTPHL